MGKKITRKYRKKYTRRPRRKQRKTRKVRKSRRQRGGTLPAPVFPTKEKLMQDLGEWKTIHCLKYKKGSVMVVENDLDTKGIMSCSLFKIDTTINPDKLYQYIMYQIRDEVKLLLSPTYAEPEIGTKHKCLLQRVPDGSLILGSGELLRRDDTIFYSCMSSLFFMFMFKRLFPDLKTKEERNVAKKNYEENEMMKFMRSALPDADESRIIYVKDINKEGDVSKGASGEDVRTGDADVQILKPETFCTLPEEERPACLRYVTNEDCSVLENHPKDGYCEAGVDFCTNLQHDSPPTTVIPESAYHYDVKVDPDKANAFLQQHGKRLTANKFMNMKRAKDLANELGTPHEIKSKTQVWP